MAGDANQQGQSDQGANAQAQNSNGDADLLSRLTGQESDADLQQSGIEATQGRTYERIRQLARERNEERQRVALLQAELQRLQVVQPQAQAQNGQQNGQAAKPVYDKPAPGEDATDQERLEYLVDKRAYERSHEQVMAFGAELIKSLTPIIGHSLRDARDKEWAEMDSTLQTHNTSREEIEPYVQRVLEQQPHRSLRSVTFDVIDQIMRSQNQPKPPAPPRVNDPSQSQRRTVVNRGNPSVTEVVNGLMERAAASRKDGRNLDASNAIGLALLGRQDGRSR